MASYGPAAAAAWASSADGNGATWWLEEEVFQRRRLHALCIRHRWPADGPRADHIDRPYCSQSPRRHVAAAPDFKMMVRSELESGPALAADPVHTSREGTLPAEGTPAYSREGSASYTFRSLPISSSSSSFSFRMRPAARARAAGRRGASSSSIMQDAWGRAGGVYCIL